LLHPQEERIWLVGLPRCSNIHSLRYPLSFSSFHSIDFILPEWVGFATVVPVPRWLSSQVTCSSLGAVRAGPTLGSGRRITRCPTGTAEALAGAVLGLSASRMPSAGAREDGGAAGSCSPPMGNKPLEGVCERCHGDTVPQRRASRGQMRCGGSLGLRWCSADRPPPTGRGQDGCIGRRPLAPARMRAVSPGREVIRTPSTWAAGQALRVLRGGARPPDVETAQARWAPAERTGVSRPRLPSTSRPRISTVCSGPRMGSLR